MVANLSSLFASATHKISCKQPSNKARLTTDARLRATIPMLAEKTTLLNLINQEKLRRKNGENTKTDATEREQHSQQLQVRVGGKPRKSLNE
jgi:hypothetical protein